MAAQPFTIFLVEDNMLDFEILKRTCTRLDLDLRIMRAVDGQEGLDMLRTDASLREICSDGGRLLILLDINMPRMNGHEFLLELRADKGLAHLPVVMFTTSDHHRDLEQAFARNVAGYFTKPNRSADLMAKVQAMYEYWSNAEFPSPNPSPV